MTGRLEGRVVVVTGAARGMGRADAELAAAEGAVVWATDVRDEEGRRLERERITYRHLDVTDEAAWAGLATEIAERDGRVDGLVNNAGIASRERLPDVDPAAWHRALEVNVTGPLLGMQALRPLMRPGASIVNVVSVAGLAGHVAAAYTTSKWALRGLSRVAALEFGADGIRVNAILPGLIDTPLMESASPAFTAAALADTPLGRSGTPSDVAPLVVHLLSAESSFTTGAEIVVDGGLTSHVSHKRIADAIRPPAG
ncbi:SDR family oxidoreductase [Amnibacterium sp. CER49]|uniref:SDR family NAD(P)-dependent oxidoreductase n=1 Tax=Amnibacterium sp. CER49 TaxID=3039161 RepID=UPI003264B698